ncbi:MAG: tetratricopeptide repeat protein, partial [Chlorobium sp.]
YKERYSQAGTLHQLGRVAEEQGKWEEATSYFLEAAEIFAHYQDQHSLQIVLGSLFRVWRENKDPAITEKLGTILNISPEKWEAFLSKAGEIGGDEERPS